MNNTKHATGWDEEFPSPAQLKEFFSQIESGRINKVNLQAFLRNGAVLKNQDLAQDILGKDFISPDEVSEAITEISYSKEQLKALEDSIPSKSVLKTLRENNMALMPSPPESIHLLAIRFLNPKLFCSSSEGWYSKERERRAFSEKDTTSFGWLAIRKDELPDSPSKSFDEQSNIMPENMRIPNAAESAWFLTTYKEVRNINLFEDMWARTSSISSDGHHVYLGFDKQELIIPSDCIDERRLFTLALAVAWKF